MTFTFQSNKSFQKEFEKTVIGLSRGKGSRGDILDPYMTKQTLHIKVAKRSYLPKTEKHTYIYVSVTKFINIFTKFTIPSQLILLQDTFALSSKSDLQKLPYFKMVRIQYNRYRS